MQTTFDELTKAPIPNSAVLMRVNRGAGVEKIGSEVDSGKKRGREKGILRFSFYFLIKLV